MAILVYFDKMKFAVFFDFFYNFFFQKNQMAWNGENSLNDAEMVQDFAFSSGSFFVIFKIWAYIQIPDLQKRPPDKKFGIRLK